MTKSQIVLDRPIKGIGMHDVKVALHPEVAVTVRVNVARSPEEADLQLQGIDVMAQMFERDAAPPPEELQPVAATDEAEESAGEEPAAETAEAETADAETAEAAPAEENPAEENEAETPTAEEGEQPA